MRLWEDGFDHYGSDENNMLDGSYASIHDQNPGGGLITSEFATGTNSYSINKSADLIDLGSCLRKILPSSKTKLGAMARFFFPHIPGVNGGSMIFAFHSTSTPARTQISINVDANGAIRVYRGSFFDFNGGTGTLIYTSNPVIVAGAWNHIEVQVNIHDTLGWVRVAVNGAERFVATGLDTAFDSSGCTSISQYINPWVLPSGNPSNCTFYMDDLVYYDFTGDSAVDTDFCPTVDGSGVATGLIGELQVWPLFPNGDTSEADWAKSTGMVGYSLIDEIATDDADYIYSANSGDLSEFALQDLPVEITYVRGLGIHSRLSKSDGGVAMFKAGMKSVAATSDAAERPVTTEPTFWHDAIDVDPNSGARWTRTSLNAAWLRLTRSA